ncbi:hypothetical protein [Streptomyces sp. 1222.5]|uniref:hypothetical protein n=1 Tax=Streptomyces sp. 1222.5 TaxID=1881026 RepID=UPI003D710DBC
MPEPLTADYLRKTQQIIASVPAGPWEAIGNDFGGEPCGVGPISFLETASDDQAAVVAFVGHAREALPRYVGEVSRQRAQIRALESRVRQLEQVQGGDRDAR